METLHELENISSVLFVQISGRFIGKQQCGMVHQRAGNCHALLLASGKLSGPLFGSTGQPHLCKPLTRRAKRLPQCHTPNQQRHRYVFRSREIRQEVMTLPDKTNGAIAKLCQLRL
jgi:acyl-CoA thioesterase-1